MSRARFNPVDALAGAIRHDVVIVGAGAAGVGAAVPLLHAGVQDILVVDRHAVGASFDRWPKEPAVISTRACSGCSRGAAISAIAFGAASSYQLAAGPATWQTLSDPFPVWKLS